MTERITPLKQMSGQRTSRRRAQPGQLFGNMPGGILRIGPNLDTRTTCRHTAVRSKEESSDLPEDVQRQRVAIPAEEIVHAGLFSPVGIRGNSSDGEGSLHGDHR